MTLVDQLQPDLIIANKEENVKEQIETLSAKWPVWVSDVNNLEEALSMIHAIGSMTERTSAASQLISKISTAFQQLPPVRKKTRTAYLIWKDPYMTVGADTFIHSMLEKAGFENIYSDKTRYPEITLEELKAAECELLLLSSEPYPFRQKHIEELKVALPGVQLLLADGEMFSWYGSRLLKTPAYIQKLREMIN